jgi:hypothetical protein
LDNKRKLQEAAGRRRLDPCLQVGASNYQRFGSQRLTLAQTEEVKVRAAINKSGGTASEGAAINQLERALFTAGNLQLWTAALSPGLRSSPMPLN